MKSPKVTIFVPVKNGERTLKKCIDSLLRLDYPEKEIWFLDNMSTDATPEILKSYGKKIKWKKMAGKVPKLHNYILRNVKTEYLAYTNADCVVKKDWLKKLIEGFDSDDIVATGGFYTNPKGLKKLQFLIGKEIEERAKKFPEFTSRLPDGNLCVRADVAKKIKFNENFFWSWESDFGYRLTKKGKMKYIPEAVVYHYHRSTWKGFFKQQFNNGKATPLLFLTKKKEKIVGDHISTSSMGLRLLLFYLFFGFLFLGLFFKSSLFLSLIFSGLFLLLTTKDSIKFSDDFTEFIYYIGIFLTRTAAWAIGIPLGIIYLLFNFNWRD